MKAKIPILLIAAFTPHIFYTAESQTKKTSRYKSLYVGTDDFLKLSKSCSFVDQTMLLKLIFDYKYLMLTAPSGFMKSSNLNMIKAFLNPRVNESGHMISSKTQNEEYIRFRKCNIFKAEPKFFWSHFQKYPVMLLQFKPRIWPNRFKRMLEVLREEIHRNFKEYRYICSGGNLSPEEENICASWSDATVYKHLSRRNIMNGFRNLRLYLYKHFKTQVYILVDDFDVLILKISKICGINRSFKQCLVLYIKLLTSLFRNNPMVKGGILAGMSRIIGSMLFHIQNMTVFSFLGKHEFVTFFGITNTALSSVYTSLLSSYNRTKLEGVIDLYGGYTSLNGTSLVDPRSFLYYLKHGVEDVWNVHDRSAPLESIFDFEEYWVLFDELLASRSLRFNFIREPGNMGFIKLRNMHQLDRHMPQPTLDLVMNFIFDMGFLTYTRDTIDTLQLNVTLPNRATWESMLLAWKTFYIEVCRKDEKLLTRITRENFSAYLEDPEFQ